MSQVQFIVGFHAVLSRLRHAPETIIEVYVDEGRRDKRLQEALSMLKQHCVQYQAVDTQTLDHYAKGVRHQGVVAKVNQVDMPLTVEELLDRITGPVHLLILDGVTDPHNLGACLRSADAAGVHAVIAPKDRSVGLNATVRRVACGAAEHIPYITVTNLARTLRMLKEHHIWVVGTSDQAQKSLYDLELTSSIAWVMGAEGDGIRRLTRETCDELVSLPMQGTVESLNVSVASAICMYETLRQRIRTR